MVQVGGSSTPDLLEKGRSVLPSPLGVVRGPLFGPPIMVHYRSGVLRRAGPVMMVPEPSPRVERLRLPNRLVTNSRHSKWTVSPMEKPSHGECSPLVAAMNAIDGTIKMV
jgi:hypothetical protein